MKKDEQESLYFLLNSAIRFYYLRTHKLLEEIGLYPGQPRVLHALWRKDGLSQKEIAKQLNIKPSTVTVMINRMEKAELVRRKQDPEDLRVSKIYLQKKAIDLKDEVKEVAKVVNDETFAGFSEDEKELMGNFLKRMSENLKIEKENK